MKKLVVLMIVASIGLLKISLAQDEAVKWYSIEEALELNKTEQRKIFIDVYTGWCGWCKKMDATTFSNPTIAKILNEDYYAVKFDAETNDTINFGGQKFMNEGGRSRSPHQLAVAILQGKMSYPSMAVLHEYNQAPIVIPGYKTANILEPILMFIAENAYKSQTFEDYQKKFKSGIQTN